MASQLVILSQLLLVALVLNVLQANLDQHNGRRLDSCQKFLHKEILKRDDCTAEVYFISCRGYCHSTVTPIIYRTR